MYSVPVSLIWNTHMPFLDYAGYYQGPPAGSSTAGEDKQASGGGKPDAPKKEPAGFMDNLSVIN